MATPETKDSKDSSKDAKDARGDDPYNLIIEKTKDAPDGAGLCRGAAGTGHNAGTPYHAYGDAAKGNCYSQVRIKDY